MRSKWQGPAFIRNDSGCVWAVSAAAQAVVRKALVRRGAGWSDEFNGPNGSAVDSSKWISESGGGGWGNNELEYYTSRLQNAWQQDGNLVIKVLQEKYTGADGVTRDYTSARLKTLGKFSQAYGRFEARIKIPRGQGIWPAFWMLGNDIEKPGWPDCGEIDIMENIGKEPALVHGTIHGPGYIWRGRRRLALRAPSGPALRRRLSRLRRRVGNRTRSASTSTSTCTRRTLHPTCRRGRSGFTTIHSSCCSTWRLAADGRGILTRPQSFRKRCWWIIGESMSAQVRQPPRHNTEQLLSWACEGCRDGKAYREPDPFKNKPS